MDKLLQVQNLSIEYRSGEPRAQRAVSGISFDITRGEIVGLMGESGCGKSTTALAMLGLFPAQNCKVLPGVSLTGRGKRRLSISVCIVTKR